MCVDVVGKTSFDPKSVNDGAMDNALCVATNESVRVGARGNEGLGGATVAEAGGGGERGGGWVGRLARVVVVVGGPVLVGETESG